MTHLKREREGGGEKKKEKKSIDDNTANSIRAIGVIGVTHAMAVIAIRLHFHNNRTLKQCRRMIKGRVKRRAETIRLYILKVRTIFYSHSHS